MKSRIQLIVIVLVLVLLGSGLAFYKHIKLGFPLTPTEKETVWTVEATVTFTADGGPVQVSLNLPDAGQFHDILERNPSLTRDFTSEIKGGRIVWEAQNVEGPQTLFLQSTIYRRDDAPQRDASAFDAASVPAMDDAPQKAAENIVKEVRQTGKTTEEIAVLIMAALNDPLNPKARRLLDDADEFGGKLNLAAALLNMAGVEARAVKGLDLAAAKKKQKLKGYIQIQTDEGLRLLSPRSAEMEDPRHFLLWSKHDESILEVTGGSGSELSLSTQAGRSLARSAAIKHGKFRHSLLVDFSIYSLPLAHQNTFKLLLMIPIGALIVVFLRNIVGLQTAGTFMPILIAMVFLQVDLLAGLTLFVLIVGIGLVLRGYLSHLNLLLVPRISAVLVFVIIIYVAISVISIKLDIEAGLRVTFFPMIIISWTIERMSVLWEEEGPRDVFVKGGGTLLSATLIYLVMKNSYVAHLTFTFPELLLVLLALIIMIGSYTGYRLSELRRFEPLVRE